MPIQPRVISSKTIAYETASMTLQESDSTKPRAHY
jgi:hypothetical protein